MSFLESISRGAPASALLLGAIVLASLAGFRYPALLDRGLLRPHALVPRRAFGTLVTSGFLHADLAHLLFNSFTFWAFGFGLERTIGSARFLALYAFGLVASGFGTWLRHRRDPGYRTLGASGAILAVLFASILYFPRARLMLAPIPVPVPAPLFAAAYLAYSTIAARRQQGGVNHDAHVSGALAGIAFVAWTDFDAVRRALHAFG